MLELKCLKNLYNMINDYYEKLKQEYKKELNQNKFEEFEIFYSLTKQQLLNYKTGIYRNIENKKIPFIEMFNTENEQPYGLNSLEAEIIRNYIGLYDDGKKQSISELSKMLEIPKGKINSILQMIMLKFNTESFQKQFLEERNEFIRKNIETLRTSIPEYDISFLNITDNFIEILRAENINKIKDILNINETQIKNMNIGYGYNSKIVVFPKRTIKEIESLGLKFKNNETLDKLFDKIEDENIDPEEGLGENLKTLVDIICARQFEPELINRLNVEEQLNIDNKINNGYLTDIYSDIEEETLGQKTQLNFFEKTDIDYTNGKTFYMNKN